LNDARRFVFKNRQIAETAPLQLYSSALMFSPKSSVIRTLFANELKIWPQLPIVEESWNAELQTLEGHTDQVHSLCGSADGQRLASGCRDGTIKLWDSATGQLQQTLSGHSDIVILINFSHDNQQLISASADGVIKLWDATTGELQQTIENHSDWVDTVVFSPDNRQIASYLEDGTVKVWKATARKTLQALEECPSPVDSIALQPDGQQVVSELEDQTFKPRDFDLRQRLQTLEKDSGSIGRVAFSPDGQRLASSSKDGIIMLWVPTADTLQPGKQFRSRGPALLEFSPDGQKLAAASNDMVELWNIEKGVVEGTCDGRSHRPDEYGRITSLRFSSDGRNLAFDPFDKTIRVWNLTSDPPQIFSGHSRAITSFVFLPGRQQLASASEDRTIKIWDLTAGKSQHSTNEKGFSGSTKSIAFSPDGGQLATGLSDGTIKIWDPSTGKMTQRFQAHEYAVQSVAFSAKGYRPLVLASGSDTTIRLWDPQTGQKAWPLQPIHSAEVRSLCFLPDNRLVSGWSSGHITVRNIKVWNTTTSQRDKTISAHEASVESISFTEDGQMVSGSDDGTCKLWDLAASTDQPKQVFHSVDGDYAASMQKIAISPQDQQLAGSSPNGPTNVWNLSENPSRQIHERHSNWVWTTSGARISILDGQWICLNGERTLWLPKQYRADCLAVSHERIALGHPSGNVSFIMMPQAHA
jgi:WD40 repeat protein